MRKFVLATAFAVSGCSLFQELQSVDSATTGEDTSTSGTSASDSGSGTAGAACDIAHDDRCVDQDTLHTCDPGTGDVTVYACADLCGTNLNFTCLRATNDGQHACWCVVPGVDTLQCLDLESCLHKCSDDEGGVCSDNCFSRANASTIRTYGALVYCAHSACADTCRDSPEVCGSCVETSIANGTNGCTVERSLCDEDMSDEPW